MELYTLDSLFRRKDVIDQFESMTWAERWTEWGDFELHIISTPETRRLLPTGTFLAMDSSYRVMKVEFVEDTVSDDGQALLKVSGRSLEAILEDRTARSSFATLTALPKWNLTGTPGNIARKIFDDICRTNVNFPADEIPFLQVGSLFPPGTIAEFDVEIEIEISLSSVYAAIKEICEAYDLGFRILRNFDTSQLYFDIYSGNDRTTRQTILAPVVFAPNLDNLTNISSITSITSYKNVAHVFHPDAVQIVIAGEVDTEVSGFDRRVLTVDASDIKLPDRPYTVAEDQEAAINALVTAVTEEANKEIIKKLVQKKRLTSEEYVLVESLNQASTLTAPQKTAVTAAISQSKTYSDTLETPWLNNQLQQRGRDELAKNRQVRAFDGELPANSPYKYEIAYQLGDLVEMRNVDGVTNQMRVTEQIFVSDASGERSYPTLTMYLLIAPDTWFGWDYNDVWATADPTWAEA